jgi:hypothetical protein
MLLPLLCPCSGGSSQHLLLFVYRFSRAGLHWSDSTLSSNASLVVNLLLIIVSYPLSSFLVSQPSVSTSAMSPMATKLNKRNYRQWDTEAEAQLRVPDLGKYISGEMHIPRPPIVASTRDTFPTTTPAACGPWDTNHDILLQWTDRSYLNEF